MSTFLLRKYDVFSQLRHSYAKGYFLACRDSYANIISKYRELNSKLSNQQKEIIYNINMRAYSYRISVYSVKFVHIYNEYLRLFDACFRVPIVKLL